jgi:hypothetical protein
VLGEDQRLAGRRVRPGRFALARAA